MVESFYPERRKAMPTLVSIFTSQQDAQNCAKQIKQERLSSHVDIISPNQWDDKMSPNDCTGNNIGCEDANVVMMNIYDAEPGNMSMTLMSQGVPQPQVLMYQNAIQHGNVLCVVKDIKNTHQDPILNIAKQYGALSNEIYPYSYPTQS